MQTVSWAGSTYNIPNQRGDTPWSGLSDFAIAVAAKGINVNGGNFTLLADINYGATFGLVSTYYKSRTANIATAGILRLASADTIQWRNNANGANVSLSKNSSDELLWNGSRIILAGGGLIVNADISASAAIAFSKLATLTSGNILVGSVGNVPTAVALSGDATLVASGALTLTTVNSNVGSFTNASITVNAKGLITAASNGTAPVTSVSGTANQITSTGGTTPVLALASPLTLPGAMTAGGAIAMGSNKITGLAAATANGDALRFEQLHLLQNPVVATNTGSTSTSSGTFQDTGTTATITPTSASSRILIFVSGALQLSSVGAGTTNVTVKDGGGNIGPANGYQEYQLNVTGTSGRTPCAFMAYKSPGTTSAQTYTVQLSNNNGQTTVWLPNGSNGTIILMEVL